MSGSEDPVVLENSLLRVEILPALEGKISSLHVKRNGLEVTTATFAPLSPAHLAAKL